jgi:4-hydroxybenzoate polyprenyltransferase/phosphoserine phosphatase
MAPSPDAPVAQREPPLCVDLDGTLVHSDILIEAVLALLKQNLLNLVLLPYWLLKGKSYLKCQIAERVDLDVAQLPYNQPLLEYLHEQKAQGRALVLATGSHVKFAEQVAFHLGLFDEVLATDANGNLSGARKRDRLVAAFGERGFGYAANGTADLEVWPHARTAVVVNAAPRVLKRARAVTRVEEVFARPPARLVDYFRAMRLHQWLKNLLVFVPLGLAHQFHRPELLLQAGLAFLAFGLCASSVYLLNDLLDLPADRAHPTKRKRAFAAGTLPLQIGLVLIPVLLAAAFTLTLLLPPWFLGTLALYYGLTLAYSLRLKRAVLLDALTLAALYTLRVIAGAAATGVLLSFWLLAFSMFFFLSLALVKRYAELLLMQREQREEATGRGYALVDLQTLAQFGITSGYLSVLVLALYVNSTAVRALYRYPEVIWLVCPIFLYWISYIWLLTRRDQMHEDPVLFAIEDRRSHWLFALTVLIVWVAL